MKFFKALCSFCSKKFLLSRTIAISIVLLILILFFNSVMQSERNNVPDGKFIPQSSIPVPVIKKYDNPSPVYSPKIVDRDAGAWRCIGPSPTGNGFSGRVGFVKFDKRNDDVIYLGGANGGIWKSTDGGVSWIPKTDFLPVLSCGAFDIDYRHSVLYYASGDAVWTNLAYPGNGIYKSTDDGDSWTRIESAGLPSSTNFYKLIVDPVRDGYLYAAMQTGFYKSTDFAATWVRVLPESGEPRLCTDIAVSPDGMNIYAVGPGDYCAFCGTEGIGYWKSANGGLTFEQKTNSGFPHFTNLPAARTCVSLCESSPNVVYILTSNDEYIDAGQFRPYYIYKSTNNGDNFTLVNLGKPVLWANDNANYNMFVAVSPSNPNYCFVGSQSLFKTKNGAEFYCVSGYCGFTTRADFHCIDFSHRSPDKLITGNDGGVFMSEDRGESFWNAGTDLSLTQIYRIASSPANTGSIILGVQDMGVVKRDTYRNWYISGLEGDGGTVVYSSVYSDVLVGGQNNSGDVFGSIDEGSNWTRGLGYSGQTDWLIPLCAHPVNGMEFLMARNNSANTQELDIYRTLNAGKSWGRGAIEPIINQDISGLYPTAICVNPVDTNLIYVTAGNRIPVFHKPNLLFRSSDCGASWSSNWLIKGGTGMFPDVFFTNVRTDPGVANEVLLTAGGYAGKHVFRSIDAGGSWQDITSNLPNYPANDIAVHYVSPQQKEYFVATNNGVYRSNADNIVWQVAGDSLPNTAVTSLDYNFLDCSLRAATFGRSVWQLNIPGDIYLRSKLTFNVPLNKAANISDNLIICKGGSLVISSDCNIRIADGKKIIVLEGGKLLITNGAKCNFSASSVSWGGIEFVGNYGASITNCTFRDSETPIILREGTNDLLGTADKITISNCDFAGGTVVVNNRNNVEISGCKWKYTNGPALPVAGVYSTGSDKVIIRNNIISCYEPSMYSIAFNVTGGNGVYIINNSITNISVGISASSNCPYIKGNVITSSNRLFADVGIGILNCSGAFVNGNTVSGYHQGIKSVNSLPILQNNFVTSNTPKGAKTASLFNDQYSFPRLSPLNVNGQFIFDGGSNILIDSSAGDGITALSGSFPDIDFGNNVIYGKRYYVNISSAAGQSEFNARSNCWIDSPPLNYKFRTPFGAIIAPLNCPGTDMLSRHPVNMQGLIGTFTVDRGNGIFDTVATGTAQVQIGEGETIVETGNLQELQGNFINARAAYQSYLQGSNSGIYALIALSKLIYCYDRLNSDKASYFGLRNYYRQLALLGATDSAFILAAKDLSRRALIKSGRQKDALYEYEDAIRHASDSAALISLELSIIDDYTFINKGIDTNIFVGNLTYLKPNDLNDAARKVYERAYMLSNDTSASFEAVPLNFYLSQNFPNPFNPLTTVYYSIPVKATVNLKIYDILGRLLGTFISEEKEAGNYTFQWNGSAYATGVYFYRFEAGSFVETKKMVLLK